MSFTNADQRMLFVSPVTVMSNELAILFAVAVATQFTSLSAIISSATVPIKMVLPPVLLIRPLSLYAQCSLPALFQPTTSASNIAVVSVAM